MKIREITTNDIRKSIKWYNDFVVQINISESEYAEIIKQLDAGKFLWKAKHIKRIDQYNIWIVVNASSFCSLFNRIGS